MRCEPHAMKKSVTQVWIDHHLEAASSYAEEGNDRRVQEIIDRARQEVGNLPQRPDLVEEHERAAPVHQHELEIGRAHV